MKFERVIISSIHDDYLTTMQCLVDAEESLLGSGCGCSSAWSRDYLVIDSLTSMRGILSRSLNRSLKFLGRHLFPRLKNLQRHEPYNQLEREHQDLHALSDRLDRAIAKVLNHDDSGFYWADFEIALQRLIHGLMSGLQCLEAATGPLLEAAISDSDDKQLMALYLKPADLDTDLYSLMQGKAQPAQRKAHIV